MSEHSKFFRSAARSLTQFSLRNLKSLLTCRALVLASFCVSAMSLLAQTPTPVPVPTWRYDLTHAGQNTSETALTPANVNPTSFGKLFSLPVDSTVYAQPLYVPNLKMSDGLFHNVVFVATENDSVYAFDADSNSGANASPIWQISLLTAAHGAGAGATAPSWMDTGSPDVAPTVGITGTPAINLASNTMYLVASTKENGAYFSRLHAINIITGAEQAHSPANITATVAGTGTGSSGGQVSFSALWENQRTALNYYNGYVYFGYAAHGDIMPWHGWLFAYNATTLAQSKVLCLSPNDYGGGVWASGAGMPIDEDAPGGRMFVATGNGHSTSPPYNGTTEFGESVINFSLANGGLTPTDAFTAFNYQTLNDGDLDLGSGGVLMVPDQQGTHPHILVQVGKEGRIVVLDRDNLGGYAPATGTSNTNALQDIPNANKGLWNTPAYWNGNVYIWGSGEGVGGDVPKMYTLNTGVMDTTPSSQSNIISDFPGASFSVSSNGTADGIAWAVRSDQFDSNGAAVLYAWPATDLTTPLYESDTNAARDSAGPANKFSTPVVTNGKVYVSANGEVDVYGLFNGELTAIAPVITPNGGTFSASQGVTLSTTTSPAEIFYTLDGSTPTPASTLYAGSITVNTDTTIKAIASAPGYIQSGVSSATFTFTYQTPPVMFTPPGGTYLNAQTVTISDPDASAKIYYTTDGSTPSASSLPYWGPIAVPASETIRAIAIDSGEQNSNVGTSVYVIQTAATSINFGSGFSSTAGLTLNGSAIATNGQLRLTNGGLNQAGSVFWNVPINIQAFTTNFEFQMTNARANGFTFTIQNVGPTALGGGSAGLGYQDIKKSVAVKFNFYDYMSGGSNSTGVYTNGQPPLTPTVDITPSGIQLASGDAIQARIVYDGTNLTLNLLDLVTNDKFTMTQAINIPQAVGGNTAYVGFTGGTGGLSSIQKLLSWTYAIPSFLLSGSPISPIAAGSSATSNLTITPSAGFTGSVKLTCAVANGAAGATNSPTCSVSQPAAISGTQPVASTLTINTSATTTLGTYVANVTGSSGMLTQTTSLAITVSNPPAPNFTLTGTAVSIASPGVSGTSTITVTPSGGFTGSVTLACAITNSPSGAVDAPTCSAQPASISGTQPVTSALTFNTKATTTPGTYTAIVTGTSGILTQTTSVAITVNTPPPLPNFALTSTAVSIASPGASGTSTITVIPGGGFTGSVTFACAITNSPSGAVDAPTCSAQSASISGTQPVASALTINTKATTTPGTYTATVTGSSGTLTQTTSVAITISGFTLSNTAVNIASPGASGTSTITVAPIGGFTGSVTLACAIASSPTGAIDPPTCSVAQPGAISGSQAVTSILTINTTKVGTAALHNPFERMLKLGGGGTVVALLFFCLPLRRRKWQTLLGLLLFAFVAIAASGCGGSSKTTPTQTGTTAGAYTVTVTGSSGSMQATTSVAVTVQ